MCGSIVIAVAWNCTCVYASCHCYARLDADVRDMQRTMEGRADALARCLDLLFAEPDDPMASGKASGKGSGQGRPVRVPQMGEDDGPKWITEGWVYGYKVWVGDLPSRICKVAICH